MGQTNWSGTEGSYRIGCYFVFILDLTNYCQQLRFLLLMTFNSLSEQKTSCFMVSYSLATLFVCPTFSFTSSSLVPDHHHPIRRVKNPLQESMENMLCVHRNVYLVERIVS